jgi:hypothetical protein
VAEHFALNPKIEGSNLTPCTGREKILVNCTVYKDTGLFTFWSGGTPGACTVKHFFRNLRKMDRFHDKLVSSGLDKHVSLSKQTHYLTMEYVHYESVMLL